MTETYSELIQFLRWHSEGRIVITAEAAGEAADALERTMRESIELRAKNILAERRVSELEREKTESTKRWMDQTDKYLAALETAERRVEELGFALTDLVNAIQKRGGMKGTTPALDRAQAALSSDKDA